MVLLLSISGILMMLLWIVAICSYVKGAILAKADNRKALSTPSSLYS